jgi:hypothetical protein
MPASPLKSKVAVPKLKFLNNSIILYCIFFVEIPTRYCARAALFARLERLIAIYEG